MVSGRITPPICAARKYSPSIRSTRATSTSSKSRGASRPTVWGRGLNTNSKARLSWSDGVLYTTGGTRRAVVALDAQSGELLWVHRYPEGPRGAAAPRQLSGRGLAYWTDGRGDDRVLYVTPGYRLIALNAKTGQPITSFGKDGVVDLKVGVVYGNGQQIDLETGEIGLHSTPTVVKDTIIVGSSMKEGMTITTHNNTKGLVRAFDVRTGKVQWTFNTIPRPGELGNDTWLNGSWAVNGNAGVWTQITVDEELGLVYLPVESPSSDYYGGKRPGNNLFGESLVCVDLKTGQRKWHFQLVHHPIWDHDISSAPILLDVTIDGKPRKLVAQPSKQAFCTSSTASQESRSGRSSRRRSRRATSRVSGMRRRSRFRASLPRTGDWPEDSRRVDRLHARDARASGREHEALQVGRRLSLQRDALQPADRWQRQWTARRAQSGERKWWNQLARSGRGSRDRHRLRAGEHVCVHARVCCAAAAGILGHPVSGRRRRTAVPPARRRGNRDIRRRDKQQRGEARLKRPARAGSRAGAQPAQTFNAVKGCRWSSLRTACFGDRLKKGELKWQVPHGDTPDVVRNHAKLKGINIPKTGQGGSVGVLVTKTLVIAGTPWSPRPPIIRAAR